MKVKFITLGCKVNQYETQGIQEEFLSLGVVPTKNKADIYVINTCSVTKRADSKSREAILSAKKENPASIVVVCGCLAQLNSDDIQNLGVDYIVPQEKKHLLASIVLGNNKAQEKAGSPQDIWSLSITNFFNYRAFIKVQDGCDHFCTFCKIPHLRGPSRSRDISSILAEIKRISEKHREIVLCGVNLGLYGRDLKPKLNLNLLVEEILKIKSLGRLRLSSLEPLFVEEELFSFLKNEKFCPHFHFPFQYGDDTILKSMNKKETVSMYCQKVNQARAVRSGIAISCDIMVGFPDETDETFKNTVDFIKTVKPMRMHIFTFSPREKTEFASHTIKDKKTIRNRYNTLNDMAKQLSREYIEQFIGKELHMVAEEYKNGLLIGCTENYLKVHLREKVNLGKIVPVEIDSFSNGKIAAHLL